MMGEKMANWIGIGRMVGSTPEQTPVGQQTIADGKNKAKKISTGWTIAIIIFVLFMLLIVFS